MIDADPPAIPAATLILFRDRPGASAELLFVERAVTMAFAPGAIVFPGGRVDPGDEALAAMMPEGLADTAARIAAIRETIEETGVAAGLAPAPSAAQVDTVRRQLSAGRTIGEALFAFDLQIDPNALIPFARWRPSHRPTRVFDTRFYLARVPGDALATVDTRENVRLFWSSAAEVLAEAEAGRATIIFPTRCNLERLARLPDFASAVADAEAYPVKLISPMIEQRHGEDWLRIPDGLGYPVTARPMREVNRG